MKCDYIYLKNVEQIYVGMNLNKLEIDFTDNNYIFNLLAGANGSGKTSFLNSIDALHTEIIRDGKEGQKNIIYSDKENNRKYLIRHVYLPKGKKGDKKGHTVKRYFTIIDEHGKRELNENGNATTFNELVGMYLGLTQENLKILKLGTDMNSFIKLQTTERKKYISLYIKDTDLYLSMYKKINSDSILVHKMFKNYCDKLDNIGSIDNIKKEEKEVQSSLEKCKGNIDEIKNNISIINNKIDELDIPDDLDEKIISLKKKNEKNIKIKKEMQENMGDILNKDIQYIDNLISKSNNELMLFEEKQKLNESNINNLNNKINEYKSNINDIDLKLLNYDINYNSEIINSEIEKCKLDIKKYEKDYKNHANDARYLNEDQLISLINYFDSKSKEIEALEMQLDYSDLEKFDYNINYNELYLNSLNKSSDLINKIKTKEDELETIKNVMKGFTCNNSSCPLLKKFFSGSTDKEIIEKEIEDYKCELNVNKTLSEKFYALNTLKSICLDIKNYCSSLNIVIINKLKLDEKSILNKVKSNKSIINNEKVQNLINISNNVKSYIDKMNYLSSLKLAKEQCDTINLLNLNKHDYELKLIDSKNELEKFNKEHETNDIKINILKNKIENLTYIITNKKEFDELDDYINYYNNLLNLKEIYNKYIEELNSYNEQLSKLLVIENEYSKKRDKLIYQKKYTKDLIRSKKVFEENYNDLNALKEALGTKKGIPLYFVKSYLQKTKDIANEILKDAFNGELLFDNFDINEKEFNIPLIKNGEVIEDISKASAGEKALGSLALSFALMEQTHTRFNILLLDEFDGPLDKKRKRLFLHLLEKRIKKYNLEQIFIITHNSIFDDYPLNLILFKGAEVNTTNKNILFEY